MQPLQDFVFVKRHEPEEKSERGIIIPEKAREKAQFGTVLAVGPGKRIENEFVPTTVKEGDLVLIPDNNYAAQTIQLESMQILVIREDQLLAFSRKEENEQDAITPPPIPPPGENNSK